jgi:hypothetical protein
MQSAGMLRRSLRNPSCTNPFTSRTAEERRTPAQTHSQAGPGLLSILAEQPSCDGRNLGRRCLALAEMVVAASCRDAQTNFLRSIARLRQRAQEPTLCGVDCVNPSRAAALHSCAHFSSRSRSLGLPVPSAARAHSLARCSYNLVSDSRGNRPRALRCSASSAAMRSRHVSQQFRPGANRPVASGAVKAASSNGLASSSKKKPSKFFRLAFLFRTSKEPPSGN